MKTKQFIITLIVILLPVIVSAQSASKAIFEKYADQEGFTSVVISGELLKMLANDDGSVNIQGNNIDTKGFNLSQIKSIRLLHVSEGEGVNEKTINTIIKETDAALKKDKPKYTELLQIQSGKEKINVLALKEGTYINEVIVYRRNTEEKEVTLVYIEGPFQEDMVSKMLKAMNNEYKL